MVSFIPALDILSIFFNISFRFTRASWNRVRGPKLGPFLEQKISIFYGKGPSLGQWEQYGFQLVALDLVGRTP